MTETRNTSDTEDNSQPSGVAAAVSGRKSPRLPFEFPVALRVQQEGGEAVTFNTRTLSVAVNGALLLLSDSLSLGQRLLLINAKTGQEVECVVRSVREKNGAHHVGIEFAVWLPEFWGVTFPREHGDPLPPPASDTTPVPKEPALSSAEKPSRKASEKAPEKPAEKRLFGRVGPMPGTPAAHGSGSPAERKAERNVKSSGFTQRKKYLLMILPLIVLAGLWLIFRPATDSAPAPTVAAAFVLPPDIAPLIPNPTGYRLSTAADFAPQASALLQNLGQPVTGKIPGQFTGKGESLAYVMVKDDKTWRVAIIQHGQVLCDAHYQSIAIAGRVPHEVIRRINWIDGFSGQPEGDGLLIVRSAALKDSAVVLFLQGADVISGTPADYEQIPLLQDR